MRVIFFGSGAFGLPTLEALLGAGGQESASVCEVAAVVTQPDRPAGRGRKSTPTPVREFCDRRGVRVMAVPKVNDEEVVRQLIESGARLGVVVAFGQKIGRGILEGLPGGCINLHASLLPKYRGAGPIHRAILNEGNATGVTVFRLTDRMDAGPILTSAETRIGESETTGELHDRLAELGVGAVLRALEMFSSDTIPPGEVQNESEATTAPKLGKSDGAINWSAPAEQVARLIHAMSPWPGATTTFVSEQSGKVERVTILRVRVSSGSSAGAPGTLTEDLRVRCGGGELGIEEIKPAGSRAMNWRDFANGRRVSSSDRFG